MSEDDIRSLLTEALASTPNLSDHLDEDTSEYIISILIDDPSDEDAREAVTGFISSSIDDEHGEEVCGNFFEILDGALCGNGVGKSATSSTTASALDDLPRRLDNAITLKSHDIQTFASGLVANSDQSSNPISEDDENTSDIQSFYANMIDVSNVSAKSERERRKARQKEMREKMEEEERKRAIDDAMRMMEDDNDAGSGRGGGDGEMREDMAEVTTAVDNAADVHFTNFNLPNKRGGGPDLLTDATLTLAGGRKYGLMGRNGCGKTTMLTALAARQLESGIGGGIPKNMSMLLVRQEIGGNEMSAVETVMKSDVKREGVKRWIEFIEGELTKLDNPITEEKESDEPADSSKGKQKLRDRKKKSTVVKAAASKTKASSEETSEDKRKRLNAKLTVAYERLARIEQEEGDPEPRARKVLFGLGFITPEMQNKPTKQLSGGWRMRVSLSCALFGKLVLFRIMYQISPLDAN